jgi:FKBP-type peptidyl-prolyl cis-trans isomerase
MKRVFRNLVLLVPALAGLSPAAADEKTAALSDIRFSFKLDPRLTSGVYGSERWVSQFPYMGATAQDRVEAKAVGIDAKGTPIRGNPGWIAADPEMVTVSPPEGEAVTINVKRDGESRLFVNVQGISRELIVHAATQNGFMQFRIDRVEVKQPAEPDASPESGKQPARANLELSDAQRAAAAKELAEKNKKDGEAFLAENKTKEGIVVLESGLQYRILKSGAGPKPTIDDIVVCRFRGTRTDGTLVASSYPRNLPIVLPLKLTMQGWKEALQLMAVGSQWQVFIPPQLAYGEQGSPRSRIGPNATLIFDIELVAIQNAASAKASTGPKPSLSSRIHRR